MRLKVEYRDRSFTSINLDMTKEALLKILRAGENLDLETAGGTIFISKYIFPECIFTILEN